MYNRNISWSKNKSLDSESTVYVLFTNLLILLYCLHMTIFSLWDTRHVGFGYLLWSECVCAHQIYMLKSQAPSDGIMWCGPWEIMTGEGGASWMELVALSKIPEIYLSPSCHLRIQKKSVECNQEAGSHQNPTLLTPCFEFQPLECEQGMSAPYKLLSLCYVVNGVWMV